MRRAAASILVTLGLISAGVAWWAYAARYTVLDPARSERIADTLITQPVIQDAVAEGLGNALLQALPPGTPISPEQIERRRPPGAGRPAGDGRPEDRRPLLAPAPRRRLRRPGHARRLPHRRGRPRRPGWPPGPNSPHSLPDAPTLSVDLPTQHLPKLGWLPERTRELFGLALAAGPHAARPRDAGRRPTGPKVLSRAGRWALRAGFFWALFGWGLPYLMTKIGEPRLAALGRHRRRRRRPDDRPRRLVVSAGIGALLGARAWRLALAALPPAPPVRRPPSEPGPAWPNDLRNGRPGTRCPRPRSAVAATPAPKTKRSPPATGAPNALAHLGVEQDRRNFGLRSPW